MSQLTPKNIKKLNSKRALKLFLKDDHMSAVKALRILDYEAKLKKLQEELIKLQQWVEDHVHASMIATMSDEMAKISPHDYQEIYAKMWTETQKFQNNFRRRRHLKSKFKFW